MTPTPFRFAVQGTRATSAREWVDLARKAEDLGYSTLFVADHYPRPGPAARASSMPPQHPAPIAAMTAAALVTETLRVGCRVFCVDYHVPAALVKEAATVDLLSDGRLEHPRGHQGRPDDPARDLHQRGPAPAHDPPRAGLPGLHPTKNEGTGEPHPGLLPASLDPLVGGDRFDCFLDLGAQLPMRVIDMLVGIPDADQPLVRDQAHRSLRRRLRRHIPWRERNPSDDLITELLAVEFTAVNGTVRRLHRDEPQVFLAVTSATGVSPRRGLVRHRNRDARRRRLRRPIVDRSRRAA